MERAEDQPRRGRLRKWAVRVLLLGLLAGAVVVVFHRPLLLAFASSFRVDDPAASDALVVLLGQWEVRPVRAAELYRRGVAPLVLLGSTAPQPYPDLSESALNRAVLLRSGVPADAIQVLGGSDFVTSTRDEALRVRDYARTHPLRRITVVTTAFHTARARWIFRKVLQGKGLEIRMAAATDPRFDESSWYTDVDGLIEYGQEALKMAVYRLAY